MYMHPYRRIYLQQNGPIHRLSVDVLVAEDPGGEAMEVCFKMLVHVWYVRK